MSKKIRTASKVKLLGLIDFQLPKIKNSKASAKILLSKIEVH